MIAQLKGEVVEKLPSGAIILDVGGVGYELILAEPDFEECSVGESAKFFTYFHVRENSQELFGFSSLANKQFFELLLSVSGVGPKMAVSLISIGSESQLKGAIASENIAYLTSASGVGKKLAEKVIVELKDKVAVTGDASPLVSGDDAHDALVALGYSAQQANKALAGVDKELKTEERVKAALKDLS